MYSEGLSSREYLTLGAFFVTGLPVEFNYEANLLTLSFDVSRITIKFYNIGVSV